MSIEAEEAISARHEAAHAVVAVRLGLPLVSVDIHLDPMEMPDGTSIVTAGFTALDQTITHQWTVSLPDSHAVERITAIATQIAAGCVAEEGFGKRGSWRRPR